MDPISRKRTSATLQNPDAFEAFIQRTLHYLQTHSAEKQNDMNCMLLDEFTQNASSIVMVSMEKTYCNNFFGRFERSIQNTKKELICIIKTHMDTLVQIGIEETEVIFEKLRCISTDYKIALEKGILDCYQYISQMEKTLGDGRNDIFKKIRKVLQPPVKFSIVYKQYIKRKVRKGRRAATVTPAMLEDNSLRSGESVLMDDNLLSVIEQEVSKKQFMELILSYAKEQQMKIESMKEICRICECQFSVDSIAEHVKYCHNKYLLQEKLFNNKAQLEKLLPPIKEYLYGNQSERKKHKYINTRASVIRRRSSQLSTSSQGISKGEQSKQFSPPSLQQYLQELHSNNGNDQIEQKQDWPERMLIKLLKKVIKYIESLSTGNNGLFSTNREEKIYITQISQMLMTVEASANQCLKTFSELFRDRIKIQQKIKKTECEYFRISESESRVSSSVESFNSSSGERFQKQDKSVKKSRFCGGKKTTIDEDKLSEKTSSKKLAKKSSIKESKGSQEGSVSVHVPSRRNPRIQRDFEEQEEATDLPIRKMYAKKNTLIIPSHFDEDTDSASSCSDIHANSEKYLKCTEFKKPCLKDFEILDFLGKGAFGKVYLVRRQMTHDLYAMKVVKISNEGNPKNIQNIVNEHDIFRKISGDFLVKAAFSFSEGDLHMFFLEYMKGGDFAQLLEQEVYLTQDQAKFYIAQIVLAIEHLHKLNIIHRDLKPQNLVLDAEGHLKLTDFGLSKEGIMKKMQKAHIQIGQHSGSSQPKTRATEPVPKLTKRRTLLENNNLSNSSKSKSKSKVNIIGTPDYIAPEIINGESVDNSTIDWWSLGVIIYQVLVGEKPFGDVTIEKVFDNILNLRIEWPPIGYEEGMMTPESQEIIKRLLDLDCKKRLGANGVEEIKNHPFFEGIDWATVKNMTPPFPCRSQTQYSKKERKELRAEIQEMARRRSRVEHSLTIQLNNMVRVDLLLQETLKAGEQTKRKKEKELAYLNELWEKYEEHGSNQLK